MALWEGVSYTHTHLTHPCVGPVGILADDSMCPFNVLIQIPRPENIVAQRLFSPGKKKTTHTSALNLLLIIPSSFCMPFSPNQEKLALGCKWTAFCTRKSLGLILSQMLSYHLGISFLCMWKTKYVSWLSMKSKTKAPTGKSLLQIPWTRHLLFPLLKLISWQPALCLSELLYCSLLKNTFSAPPLCLLTSSLQGSSETSHLCEFLDVVQFHTHMHTHHMYNFKLTVHWCF